MRFIAGSSQFESGGSIRPLRDLKPGIVTVHILEIRSVVGVVLINTAVVNLQDMLLSGSPLGGS